MAVNPIPARDEVTMDSVTQRGTPDAADRDLFGEGGDNGTRRTQRVLSPARLGVPTVSPSLESVRISCFSGFKAL